MISKEFHASRRKLYAERMEDDSIAFVFAENELPDKGDELHPFTPYANFYYLTGFDQPKSILKMTKRGGRVQEVLYIRRTDERMKRWLGVVSTKESVQAETGIERVEYLDCFRDEITLFGWPGAIKCVYVDMANWCGEDHLTQAQKFAAELRTKYPDIPIRNTFNDLALIRQVKTDEEIALHRKACQVTADGVKCMLSHLRPGLYEYEAQAYFDFMLKRANARHAFATIAASGANACVMHYSANDRRMQDGEMILFDLGAECGYYAADVSRTYPVNGRFTEQQKALYNVVLKGLEAAIAAARPGQPKNELAGISKDVMARELVRLGMIERPEEISKFYFHGSGHYIGLYTHDVGNDDAPLEENMMFTLEPGLYFDDLKLGIRIEDTLLVTRDGCEVLSASIPKTVEEIEAFMQAGGEAAACDLP